MSFGLAGGLDRKRPIPSAVIPLLFLTGEAEHWALAMFDGLLDDMFASLSSCELLPELLDEVLASLGSCDCLMDCLMKCLLH